MIAACRFLRNLEVKMGIFIPKTHGSSGEPNRWCKTCCKGPARSKAMYKIRQGPVDFWFCSTHCAEHWAQHRYNPKYAKLFKISATDRLSSIDCDKHEKDLPSPCHSDVGVRHIPDSNLSL